MRLSDWSHASMGNVLWDMKAAPASTNPVACRDNATFYFVGQSGQKRPGSNFVDINYIFKYIYIFFGKTRQRRPSFVSSWRRRSSGGQNALTSCKSFRRILKGNVGYNHVTDSTAAPNSIENRKHVFHMIIFHRTGRMTLKQQYDPQSTSSPQGVFFFFWHWWWDKHWHRRQKYCKQHTADGC